MFTSPSSYSVTPGQNKLLTIPRRASSLIRDVKRRSVRRSFGGKLGETNSAGTFTKINEDSYYESERVTPQCSELVNRKRLFVQHSPYYHDSIIEVEDQENIDPQTPSPSLTPSLSRRVKRRCSSLFTPRPKRDMASTARTPLQAIDNLVVPSEISGKGRLIPVREGYMYKRSKSSGIYRRKFVILCSDGILSYFQSFQAYIDNIDGKEIILRHVTVKIPGRKPSGLTTVKKNLLNGEECDFLNEQNKSELYENIYTENPEESIEQDQIQSSELVLYSLDGSQWHFQLCSINEVFAWEKAIRLEIQHALSETEEPSLEQLLHAIDGNSACADCGSSHPDWASVNLGILLCIQCSGIHRNLGSHVSRVRSLSLDTWTEGQVKKLESIGNSKSNAFWEAEVVPGMKPSTNCTRERKENFIKLKYVSKTFCGLI